MLAEPHQRSEPTSEGVEPEGVVGELLLKKPAVEVVKHLAGQRGMLVVYVLLLKLLKYLAKQSVHQKRKLRSAAALAKLLVPLNLVQPVPQVHHELLQKAQRISAQLALNVQKEPPENVVDASGVGVVQLVLIFLFVFVPVLPGFPEVPQLFLSQLLDPPLSLPVLVGEGEELVEVPPQSIKSPNVLGLVYFFLLFLPGLFLVLLL